MELAEELVCLGRVGARSVEPGRYVVEVQISDLSSLDIDLEALVSLGAEPRIIAANHVDRRVRACAAAAAALPKKLMEP